MSNQLLAAKQHTGTDLEPGQNRPSIGSESNDPAFNVCTICNRDTVLTYKYEFGEKSRIWNWKLGAFINNPRYVCIHLCSTDLTLAAKVRKVSDKNASPGEIIEAMMNYRSQNPIREK